MRTTLLSLQPCLVVLLTSASSCTGGSTLWRWPSDSAVAWQTPTHKHWQLAWQPLGAGICESQSCACKGHKLTGCGRRLITFKRRRWFIEDDYVVQAASVKHSISQLVAFLDSEEHITYLRLAASVWDSPCVEEVLTLTVPVVRTAAFVNNAHFGRASAILALHSLVHDSTAKGNYGLECHSDHGRLSMFNMCHHVTFTCQAADPFFLNPSVCDTNGHLTCGHLMDTFKQVNDSHCTDAAGQRPHFQHCGLAVYGPFGHNSASHLDGQRFDLTAFWEANSGNMNGLVPGLADWAVRPAGPTKI